MIRCVFVSFISKYFLIFLWSSSCLKVCCLISTALWIFQFYLCYWFLTSTCCGWIISIFLNLLRLNLWFKTYGLSWKMSQVPLRRMYVVVVGLSALCISVRSSCFTVLFKSSIILTYLLLSCSIYYWGWGWKSPIIIVEPSLSFTSILSVFASYILMIISRCIDVYNCCTFLWYWTFY